MEIKKYLAYIDILKGIAILLMVMGHAIAWSFNDYSFCTQLQFSISDKSSNAALLWNIIYSFHMPLLFFVSGFLFYKDKKYEGKVVVEQLKRRISRILIPYFFTGFLLLFYKGNYGYWFLQVILMLNIVVLVEYWILNKLNINSPKSVVLSHVVVFVLLWAISKIHVPSDVYTTKLGNYIPFIVGVSMKQFSQFSSLMKRPSLLLLSLLTYIVLFIFKCTLGFNFPLAFILSNLMSVSICIWLYSVVHQHENQIYTKWGGRKLALIGKHSLEIYILHVYFVMSFPQIGEFFLQCKNWSTVLTAQIVYAFLLSSIAIALSLLVAKILSSVPFIKLILFGKK